MIEYNISVMINTNAALKKYHIPPQPSRMMRPPLSTIRLRSINSKRVIVRYDYFSTVGASKTELW